MSPSDKRRKAKRAKERAKKQEPEWKAQAKTKADEWVGMIRQLFGGKLVRIETVIYRADNSYIEFRTDEITMKDIFALSETLLTDEINFNFGYSPEPGYSEVTPGSDGGAGWIQVMLPKIEVK